MRDLQKWFYQTPFHNPYGWSSLVTSSAPALLHKFCFNMKRFKDLTMKTNWALALVEMEMDQQHTRKTMRIIRRHSHEEKPQSTVLLQSCEKCTLAFKEGKLRTQQSQVVWWWTWLCSLQGSLSIQYWSPRHCCLSISHATSQQIWIWIWIWSRKWGPKQGKPNSEMRALLRLSYTQAIDITTLFNTVRTLGFLLQCHLFVALLSFS